MKPISLKKTLRSIAFAAIGIIIAQAISMSTPTKAAATAPVVDNGSCLPATGCVCGLNGQNYSDKVYQAGY